MFKELYLKTIKLAGHRSSKFFLGILSFIESFIFPIPPDVLIIPMTIAKKKDWVKIALVATIGSVIGACLGYLIGYIFFNEIGVKIFELYGVDNASFLKDRATIISKKILFNSIANFFVIIELIATTPPNALIGSQARALLKDLI